LHGNEVEFPNKSFLVCPLDLISALSEPLGDFLEVLVKKHKDLLIPIILECCHHSEPDVRQSAIAVVGDIARSCIVCTSDISKLLMVLESCIELRYGKVCYVLTRKYGP
jgi:transportin-1